MKSFKKSLPLLMGILLILSTPPSCFTFSENNLITYIQSRQIWELSDEYGGFKNSEIENSSVKSTALATISLNELKIENQTIYDGSIVYISGCEQVNGGFAIDTKSNTPSLRPSYWAITALNSINSLDWVNPESINWIAERQLLNITEPWNYGGFENKVNTSSVNTEYSFYGISALHQISSLHLINSTAILTWVRARQLGDGGFESVDGFGLSDLASTFYAISALKILNGVELINFTSLISFLVSRQNLNTIDSLNYGGFGNAPSISCSIVETYFAIQTIQILNAIDEINVTAARLYTDKLQLSSGAFTAAGGIIQPTLTYSYSGLMILTILSEYETNNDNGGMDIVWISISIAIITGISSLLVLKYVRNGRSKKKRSKIFQKRKKKKRMK